MDFNDIKIIRNGLNLTQEEFANILGVNKSTVTRWEMDNKSKPTGEVERKLILLQKFYNNKDEKENIINIKNIGGISSIAALLAAAVSLYPITKIGIKGISLSSIITSSALSVFNLFKK